jgi:hypothetical protein
MDTTGFLKRTRELAKGSWQDRGDGEFWIDHRTVADVDADSLAEARHLTLWNVRLPPDFFARLPNLQILDLRGGSGTSLEAVKGALSLRALVVNQIRGLADISAIGHLDRLEFLSLYGLSRVERLPSLAQLAKLRRVELGQMRNLRDVTGLGEAPALEELFLLRRLGLQVEDIGPLREHPTLRAFDWFWEDVPASQAQPVLQALPLAKAQPMSPEEWLRERDARSG